ncbi:MAG TPA: N-acetylmannosamine-6-phosphate 2-epimerase [Edaphobacter sp.]
MSVERKREEILSALKGRLIVSCQADAGDPMDDLDTIARMARAVIRGGAAGLRAEGVASVRVMRAVTEFPIIGIVKKQDANGEVYITPTFADAKGVADAGADLVALDCTRRRLREAEPWPEMIRRIHAELHVPVLADIASVEEGLAAQEAGADAVATTLYGYTEETAGAREFSWSLLERLVEVLRIPVIAEGHIQQPEEARRALELGAHAVVVGSAITRPATITARFAAATERATRS